MKLFPSYTIEPYPKWLSIEAFGGNLLCILSVLVYCLCFLGIGVVIMRFPSLLGVWGLMSIS